jgi:predicted acetyltransferase
MYLTKPDIKYKTSFLKALVEYQKEEKSEKHNRNIHYNELNKAVLDKNFQNYVKKELAKQKGEGLPMGWVPETVFWLIDNGEFVGKINVRHRLTAELVNLGGHIGYDIRPSKRGQGYGKKMLELALLEAKKLDIENVLITCNFDNTPSKRVIEANGGIFEDQQGTKLRYWIKLK